MISDERIQHTVRTGEKNKETAVLVHNWCAHARVNPPQAFLSLARNSNCKV